MHSEDGKLKEMYREREVLAEDLRACDRAYAELSNRVAELQEMSDSGEDQQCFFLRWSGKDAMMGSMELCRWHLRDLLERYDQAIIDQETREQVQLGQTVIKFPGRGGVDGGR